jgi:hypothetical protein
MRIFSRKGEVRIMHPDPGKNGPREDLIEDRQVRGVILKMRSLSGTELSEHNPPIKYMTGMNIPVPVRGAVREMLLPDGIGPPVRRGGFIPGTVKTSLPDGI